MWIGVPNNGKRSRKLDGVQYRMKSEEDIPSNSGTETLVRAGQFWEVHGGLLEIMSIDGDSIEARKWSGLGNRLRTDTEVTLIDTETRTIPLETIQNVQKLARVMETSKKVRKITKKITNLMERKPVLCKPVPPAYTGNNLVFEGFEFDTIYTDGSWKENSTLRGHLAGRNRVTAGGAVVLGKGDKFFCISVDIDFETESAFEIEMVSLLVAIDIAGPRSVTIYSDCKSALTVLVGGYKGNFQNILSGWSKPGGVLLNNVKAHPEKFKKPEEWGVEDRGIWMADQIAGRVVRASKTLKASTWLKRISYASKVIVVDQEGVPFIKDISRRWSKHLMQKYFLERDNYREAEGKDRKWAGTNLRLSHKMMGKNKSISDLAAVQRASLDKMWRWHWAREDPICEACNKKSIGIVHPIWKCKHEEMIDFRLAWRRNVWSIIDDIPTKDRPQFEELWSCMEVCEDGAYAACGVFLPGFLDRLTKADEDLSKKKVRTLNKLLKEIGRGARNMLRIHRELNDKRIGRELNQQSIKSFLVSSKLTRKPTEGDSETSSQPDAQKKKKHKTPEKKQDPRTRVR
jgi:ribonuclease HI